MSKMSKEEVEDRKKRRGLLIEELESMNKRLLVLSFHADELGSDVTTHLGGSMLRSTHTGIATAVSNLQIQESLETSGDAG